MDGFLISLLGVSGWKHQPEIYWRHVDAVRAAKSEVKVPLCRAVKVLRVVVQGEVYYEERSDALEKSNAD